MPAYVEDFAPEGSKAQWLAVLYASIPVGSALGFTYGSLMAGSFAHGFGYAYLLEALAMLPVAIGLHLACALMFYASTSCNTS